jgi:hypothetical protein
VVMPIVSNMNGPTVKISWLLSKILTALLKEVPAHLESSITLMERLRSLNSNEFTEFPYPFSLDVVSLYTSIPVADAINALTETLARRNFHYGPLMVEDIKDLVRVVLTNTYFHFFDKIYLQRNGLPMGSNVSPILAIVFMDSLERIAIQSSTLIGFYSRYVDDIFCLGKDQETANTFKDIMNGQHPSIKFEIEHPTDNKSLNLLDLQVTIEQNSSPVFKFYKKDAKKDIFVHYKSALPTLMKKNIINNERSRIIQRCTKVEDQQENVNKFDNLLYKCGYPRNFIERTHSTNLSTAGNTHHNDWFYLKMPFINDKINWGIKSIFRAENIPIRLYHQNKSLRGVLKRKSQSSQDCSCQFNRVCHNRNVVYEVKCLLCHNSYIGSTIRSLHQRLHEHLTNENSSIYKHLQSCRIDERRRIGDHLKARIAARDNDNINLRIKEALLIKRYRPQLNAREELNELALLI